MRRVDLGTPGERPWDRSWCPGDRSPPSPWCSPVLPWHSSGTSDQLEQVVRPEVCSGNVLLITSECYQTVQNQGYNEFHFVYITGRVPFWSMNSLRGITGTDSISTAVSNCFESEQRFGQGDVLSYIPLSYIFFTLYALFPNHSFF